MCWISLSLLLQNRYLLVELIFADNASKPSMTEGLLQTIIRESLAANFGEIGWAKVGGSLSSQSEDDRSSWIRQTEINAFRGGSTVKYLSQVTGLAIVRTSRPTLDIVWAAITFIRSIKGVECCPRVLHVGGAS